MPANRFTAVVDAKLSASQVAAIDKAIQSAVLQQVARIDNGFLGRKIDLGLRTRGIYLKNFGNLDALKKNGAFKKVITK